MNLPQIRLESTSAVIQITPTPGIQSIEQPGPELDIQQPQAELHIDRSPAILTIDQSQARADVDLKSIFVRTREIAQTSHQIWLDGLARTAEEGKELMKIENHGNPIASIAKRNSEPPIYDVNIGFIPSAGSVKINYVPAKLDIQWDIKKPINNTRVRKPIINYTPGNVEIQLKQYQDLKIDFANLKYVGINYEQEI
jgi:hypothetical protein